MLHQRTSSAINLRMESSRRHSIRNLKAKVRSLLPIDICQKERRRYHKSEKLDDLIHETKKVSGIGNTEIKQEKKNNRIFQKLSKKQVEEINENKHYFLGNQESIALYETFVKECYPELIQNQWTAPKNQDNNYLPFAFIPSNLINPIQLPTYKKIVSQKRLLFQKRQSDSKSLTNFKRASNLLIEDYYIEKKEQHSSIHKAQKCLGRKQAIDEQLKIKRQISSVHLQRQQKQAQNKRKKVMKQRTQTAKYSSHTFHGEKYNQRNWIEDRHVQSDINNLAVKLRKVCLKKKKPQFDLDLMDSRVCKKILEMGMDTIQLNN